jgi:hypothetical protein
MATEPRSSIPSWLLGALVVAALGVGAVGHSALAGSAPVQPGVTAQQLQDVRAECQASIAASLGRIESRLQRIEGLGERVGRIEGRLGLAPAVGTP